MMPILTDIEGAGLAINQAQFTAWQMKFDFDQNGILDCSEIEKVGYAQLFLKSLVEQETGSLYDPQNRSDRDIKERLLSCMSHLTTSIDDFPEVRVLNSSRFFFASQDGRSYRTVIRPLGAGSASNELLGFVGQVLGRPIVEETGMMFQIKGGGPTMISIRESSLSYWIPDSSQPTGLTAFDVMDQKVVNTMGVSTAGRIPITSFRIDQIKEERGKVWNNNDLVRIAGSQDHPLVVEIFANPGGYSLADIKNFHMYGWPESAFWDYCFGQSVYYFSDLPEFAEILEKVRDGQTTFSIEDKSQLVKLITSKWLDDAIAYDSNYPLGYNRTSHNLSVFGQHDFDDLGGGLDQEYLERYGYLWPWYWHTGNKLNEEFYNLTLEALISEPRFYTDKSAAEIIRSILENSNRIANYQTVVERITAAIAAIEDPNLRENLITNLGRQPDDDR